MQSPLRQQAATTPNGKVAAMPEQVRQHPWSIEIYQVLDHDHQQRILEAFLEIEWPNVVALGTHHADDWFVIVEARSTTDGVFARRTIHAIDRLASRA